MPFSRLQRMDIVEADVWGIPRILYRPLAGKDVDFCAFLRCSSCGKTSQEDPRMTEKLERLVSSGVEVVHIGVCAQPKGIRCQTMERHAAWLEEHQIRVVRKKH